MIFWTYSSHKNHRNHKNRLHLHPCKPFSIGRVFLFEETRTSACGRNSGGHCCWEGSQPTIHNGLTDMDTQFVLVQSGRHTGSMCLNPCKSWDETENGWLNWPSTAHPSHIVHSFLRLLDIDFATPVVGMSHLCPSECQCCFFPSVKVREKRHLPKSFILPSGKQQLGVSSHKPAKNWHSLA